MKIIHENANMMTNYPIKASHVHIDIDFDKIGVLCDVERQILVDEIMKLNENLKEYYNDRPFIHNFEFKIVNEDSYKVN